MKYAFRNWSLALCFTAMAAISSQATVSISHADGLDDPLRAQYLEKLKGKKVAFLPIALSFDLALGWQEGLKRELEPYGIELIVRDPNWNSNAGAQALTTLIAAKPDVLIVHNADLQTYAKLLKKAEAEGIKVVQVNMRSVYQSTVYVGADWVEVGERATSAVVEACKGKSGKISIVQGPTSSASSAFTLTGVQNVLKDNPQIKVVSSQAADWDAAKAKGITQTVLRQNPDLCGIVGFWDGMDIGTGAAVVEAGMKDQVFLATSGGGEQRGACDKVADGTFDVDFSYDVPAQAMTMAGVVKWLLQAGATVGDSKGSIYTTLKVITPQNAAEPGMCWRLGKS
ncbi:sugar ABC transporter substrate-binding protein [Mesorhizobium sp. M0701]|uniref:sugar ABC transporter substrate-binding protein n=1 Tax=Mesorhizobium sp. M0701 TaxID=2956989 RepID=UPI003336C4ED